MLGYVLFGIALVVIIFLLQKRSPVDENEIRLDITRRIHDEMEVERKKMYAQLEISRQEAMSTITKQQKEYQESLGSIESSLEEKKAKMIEDLNTEIELRKEQNKQLKIELAKWIEEEKLAAQLEVDTIQEWIEDWRSKQNAVVESYKKLDELKNKDSHHRIVLSDDEEVELLELNKAIRKLKNPLPFRKAVYDIYYKPKINELVLRVIGQRKVCGIYKIIHVDSGRTYVGQSVDIGNRWKQHAKRGAGADVLTSNKLYPAMLEFGLESFHFEIVEEIQDNNKLNEAEKYWQNYFKAQEFGYSIK